jgi:hypothetical protein
MQQYEIEKSKYSLVRILKILTRILTKNVSLKNISCQKCLLSLSGELLKN